MTCDVICYDPQDEDFDSLIYKLNECAESVQSLETTVSPLCLFIMF